MDELKKKEEEFETEQAQEKEQAQQGKSLVARNESSLSMYLDTAVFNQAWRASKLMAATGEMVPEHFRGKPERVFLIMDFAERTKMSPFMLMQNMYIVKGKPGMEAKLMIALANRSGLFSTALDFEMFEDPRDGAGCIASATRASDGKVLKGTPVTWTIVEAEGWHKPRGSQTSKWMTMPEQMFKYRAAAFFVRLHCPEVLMGLRTVDELDDIEAANEVTVTMDPEADVPAFEVPKDDQEPAPKPEPEPPPDDDPGLAEFESPAPETPRHDRRRVRLVRGRAWCQPQDAGQGQAVRAGVGAECLGARVEAVVMPSIEIEASELEFNIRCKCGNCLLGKL
jgi:hypothetical protein